MEPNDRQLSNLKEAPKNIGIVTTPSLTTGAIPLSRLIEVLQSLSRQLYVISGKNAVNLLEQKSENVHIVEVKSPARKSNSLFSRIKHNAGIQFRVASKVVRLAGSVDIFVFLFAEGLVLPMLMAKLLRKKTVFVFTGFAANREVGRVKRSLLSKILFLLLDSCYYLSDRIILYSYSERHVEELNLKKYQNRIPETHLYFIDAERFKISKPLNEREKLIGYIGRLHEIKGVLNFVEAIPKVLKERNDINFIIGGDGNLQSRINQFLATHCLNSQVKVIDWIPHQELPSYLNELELLIMPSYAEELPSIMVEAMACGTPVLATPVGAIPNVIKDGETGFIMETNSPECIARNVIRALNHPDLEQVVRNARTFVEKEFTYQKAVENFRKILTDLGKPLHIHTGAPHKLNRGVNNDGEQNKG